MMNEEETRKDSLELEQYMKRLYIEFSPPRDRNSYLEERKGKYPDMPLKIVAKIPEE